MQPPETASLWRPVSILAVATCLLAIHGPASAFDAPRTIAQHVRRTWTPEDGLPQSSANSIVQDRRGFLWIATFAGLARFDGVHFDTFTTARYPAMGSDRLLTLFEDRDGTLWIGTERSGVSLFRGGVFHRLETPPAVSTGGVATFAQGLSGDLWVGTSRGLLRVRDGALVARYTMEDGLPGNLVRAVLENPDGSLWIGTSGGLARMDPGGRIAPVPEIGHLEVGQGVHSLLRDRDGGLWIGADRGLFHLAGGHAEAVPLGEYHAVRALLQDRRGALWVGTDPGGLFRLARGKMEHYGTAEGLPVDNTIALLEDREGNIWVGTTGGGLQELSRGQAVSYGAQEGLGGLPALPIVSDGSANGGIWVGLNCGGLAHLTPAGTETLGESDGLLNTCVWSLHRDPDGTLWIGTHGQGLHRLRPGTPRPPIEPLGGPLSTERVVRAIVRDRNGRLLVGTDSGLFRLDEEDNTFDLVPGTGSLGIYFLDPEPDGRLWLGTETGVHVIDRDGRVMPFRVPGGPGKALVRAIHSDERGVFWIGTYGEGLFRIELGRTTHFGTDNGLPDDVVSRILEDRHGRFWMTGNRGVYRVDREDLDEVAAGRRLKVNATLYGASRGMLTSECNGGGQPAGLLTDDGMLWVPTVDGVVRINTERLVTNPLAPPVLVESAVLDGHPIDLSRPVVLPPRAQNLDIHYTALSFVAPERVHFRYRLVGFDRTWVDAGTRRVAYYPLIPSGEHEFQVIAANEDGVWNEQGASLRFTAEPGFEQTPWPYLFGLAVLALLTWSTVRLRMRAIHTRQTELEREVEARTEELLDTKRELEEANRILQQLAVEDPLTGVANRRAFEERLDLEWRRASREVSPLGILMIDLDRFKAYNDTLGHAKGDECLTVVARTLAASLRRAGDLLARYGGEEFAAILPDTDRDEIETLAETLRQRIEGLGLPHPDSPVSTRVTISVGAASTVPEHHEGSGQLVRAADRALYQAKRAGKNCVRVAEAMSQEFAEE